MNNFEKILADYDKEGLLIRGEVNEQELITFTFHSTSIEGSSLTYEEVYALLNDKVAANKLFEHNQMNIDHADAYRYTLKRFKEDDILSMNFIRSVNAKVMNNTGKIYNTILGSWNESKGEIRIGSVHIGSRYFPDHKKVPGMVEKMCKKFNEGKEKIETKKDILDLAFDVHYDFVTIHPFSDGNGRTARILNNAILHRYDIPRMILEVEKKQEYYRALDASQQRDDVTPFRNFMNEKYLAQIKAEIKARKQANRGKEMFMTFG